MKPAPDPLRAERTSLTRRQLFPAAAGLAAAASLPLSSAGAEPLPPELGPAVEKIEPYFFSQERFGDVSRGNPVPHSLPEEKKRDVGLTRETWQLEVVSDPEQPATLGRQLTRRDGTALDFRGLLQLAEKHAVRFP